MRIVVLGAGSIGGSVGGLLVSRARMEVLFIARGAHGAAMREHGLRLRTPDEELIVRAPTELDAAHVSWTRDDVVLLATKTQDAEAAIRGVPADVPVVCLTNGIAAERIAAERVQTVCGAYVFMPGSHLEPGVVNLWASPPAAGVIDVGAYPSGAGPVATAVAAALRSAGIMSEARENVMSYKRGKLILNLGNVVEALCGPNIDVPPEIETPARAEAIACFKAAGLEYTFDETRSVRLKPIGGVTRPGGSTWQSLTRGKHLEVDFLNGEIVALGRTYGIPTPINAALQRIAADAVERGLAAGAMSADDLVQAVRRIAI